MLVRRARVCDVNERFCKRMYMINDSSVLVGIYFNIIFNVLNIMFNVLYVIPKQYNSSLTCRGNQHDVAVGE